MNFTCLLPCLAIALLFPVERKGEKEDKKPMIEWTASLEIALKRAKEENKPIFVAINMDGEKANEEMAAVSYRNEKLVKTSTKSINLVASAFNHHQTHREISKGGPKKLFCDRFSSVSCEEHQEVEKKIRKEYFNGSEDMISPQHLTIKPDGTLINLKQYEIAVKEMDDMIQEAIKLVGKPKKKTPESN